MSLLWIVSLQPHSMTAMIFVLIQLRLRCQSQDAKLI